MLRREISADGLFMALGFVMALFGLIISVLGLAFGTSDQVGMLAGFGGICLLILLGYAYARWRPAEEPVHDAAEDKRADARLGPFWAVIFVAMIAAAVFVNGPSRGAWVFLAIVAFFNLAAWDRRRRRRSGRTPPGDG